MNDSNFLIAYVRARLYIGDVKSIPAMIREGRKTKQGLRDLNDYGPRRVKDLRADIPDAGKILLHNVYGWFDRAERGIYLLTDAGHAALKRWPLQPLDLSAAGNSAP